MVSDIVKDVVKDVVTLKVNGKAYACKNGPAKARCKSKEFRLDESATRVSALQPSGGHPTYACVACGWLMCSSPGFNVEAFLPPANNWQTPGGSAFKREENGLWTTLDKEYGFNADLAADHENRKTPLYFCEEISALTRDWTLDELLNAAIYGSSHSYDIALAQLDIEQRGVRAFANPPYQPRGTIDVWLRKAIEQCGRGVWSGWLIPMSSSVGWFAEFVIPFGQWSTFEGRIAFVDPLATEDSERNSPKQDNLFVVFDPDATFAGHVAHRSAKTGEYLWRRS